MEIRQYFKMSLYIAPKVVVTGLFIGLSEYVKKEEGVPWLPSV